MTVALRSALRVGVADLLRRPGSSRAEAVEAVLEGLEVSGARVPDGEAVRLEASLESLNEGIVLKGVVRTRWEGECRRCLRTVRRPLTAEVLEVFEASPVEGETRPLDGAQIDLEPVARDAVLLELPLAPLCSEGCPGLCAECGAPLEEGDCGHRPATGDPRWSALDALKFD